MEQRSSSKRLVLVAIASIFAVVSFLFVQASIIQAAAPGSQRSEEQSAQPSSAIRSTLELTRYTYFPIFFLPPAAISGHVTQDGVSLAGAKVALERISPGFMHPLTITTTVTDANGNYRFYGITSTLTTTWATEKFRAVIYGELTWYTPLITYTRGTNYTFAPVDTTGIELISPPDGSTITLPHTFTWVARPAFPTDSYEVMLFWAPGSFGAGQVGYVSSAVVPLSVLQGNQFPYMDWYVRAYSPVGFGNTGMRRIYFSWNTTPGIVSSEFHRIPRD